MTALELLTNIGLPSAIVGLVIIAFIFRYQYKRLVKAALIIALVLAALIGLAQVIYHFNIKVDREPENAYAMTTKGEPVDLKIDVRVGDKILKSETIARPDKSEYEGRSLKIIDNNLKDEYFVIGYYGNQVGYIYYDELHNQGWRKVNGTPGTPKFWSTYRIYAGQSQELEGCEYGRLAIKFYAVNEGKAEVSLLLEGSGEPVPPRVLISNKGVGQQDFAGLPTFYIAIREADFADGWIAVGVFIVG